MRIPVRLLSTAAGLIACGLIVAEANAETAAPTQEGEPGGVYIMPTGADEVGSNGVAPGRHIEAPAPGIPIGEDALRKIKSHPPPPTRNGESDVAPPPSPR